MLELMVVAAIAVLILGPDEVRRLAKVAGKWMGEVRRMSDEFTSELKREAELLDIREKTLALEKKKLATPEKTDDESLKNYHATDNQSPTQPS